MKKFLLCCGVIAAVFSLYAAEKAESLLFEASFDQFSANADFGKGGTKCLSFANPDLQMRMFPGINGKGNAINLENREVLRYPALGNIDPQQGTVTVWVAPVNWKPSEKKVQVFFDLQLNKGRFRLLLYKNPYANCFYALLINQDAPGTEKHFQATSYLPDSDWPAMKYHRLDITWDAEQLKLYVDGLQTPKVRWHISTRKFPNKMVAPEVTKKDVISFGTAGWGSSAVPTHRTAFDLIQIHNRPLSPAEIKSDYEKKVPSQFGKQVKCNILTIPESAAPVSVPMNIVTAGSESKERLAAGTAALRYDKENIYLDFSADYTPRPARITKNDGNLWEDDAVELHLKNPKGNYYQFIINSKGVVYDSRNSDPKWNAGVKCTASAVNGKWVMNLVIPRKNMDAFAAGEVWKGNVFLSLMTKRGAYCFQTWFDGKNGKMFNNPGNHADLRFGGRTALALDVAPDLQNGNFELSLKRSGDEKLDVEAFILGENGEKIEFKGDLFKTLWRTPLNAGKYQLFLSVKSGKETVMLYDRIFTVNKPLELKYTCYPSKKYVEVVVDFGNSGAANLKRLSASGIPGKVTLNFNGKEYSSAAVTAKELKTILKLPLPDNLPAGTFTIDGKFDNLSSSTNFRVPDMTPYKLKIADDHTVPAPWHEIRAKGDLSFEVLDRVYTFGNSPAPVQVTSRGNDMLLAPPVWKLNGKAVKWEKAKVTEKSGDMIKLAGSGSADDVKFSWQGILHFDGVYQLDMQMMPNHGKAVINSFELSYAVPAEHSRYILSPTLLPWKNNAIDVRYEITMPNNNRDFFIWNTGIEKGFMWWPKSTANFVNGKGEKQISLRRSGEKTTVSIAIISKKAELTKTAKYTSVFLATPVKRLPEDFRKFNMSGWGRTRYQTHQPMGWGVAEAKETPEDCTSTAGLLLAHPDKFHIPLNRWKGVNVKPLLYGMPAQIANNDAEWDYFYAEWAKTPTYIHSTTKNGVRIVNEPMCGHTQVADLAAYRADNLLKSFPDLAGLYFDLSDVRFCENPHHGCGGVDAFGQPYLSSIALNMHAYMKRIYKVTRKYDREILMHAHNLFNPIAHSFNDFWYPGENTFFPLSRNPEYGYCENISLEELQSEYNPVIKGIPVLFLPQYARIAHKTVGFAHLRHRYNEFYGKEYALRTMTPMLVHDVNVSAEQIHWGTCGILWTIRHDLDLAHSEFRGYWFDDAVKTSSDKVLASWYILNGKTEYKRLIVISNFAREGKCAGLVIDAKKFGFDEKASFTDLWQKKDMSFGELNKVVIPGNHFLLIGVK